MYVLRMRIEHLPLFFTLSKVIIDESKVRDDQKDNQIYIISFWLLIWALWINVGYQNGILMILVIDCYRRAICCHWNVHMFTFLNCKHFDYSVIFHSASLHAIVYLHLNNKFNYLIFFSLSFLLVQVKTWICTLWFSFLLYSPFSLMCLTIQLIKKERVKSECQFLVQLEAS